VNLLLKNVLCGKNETLSPIDIRLKKGRITAMESGLLPQRQEKVVNGHGYFALPGLINAHDHLELNLFARLGNPPYANFYRWAADIYHPESSPLKEILSVPLRERLLWGAFKNLLSGVTTVAHHNPLFPPLKSRIFPLKVLRKYGWEHSLGHGKDIAGAFRRAGKKPFIIHAAEGIDQSSGREIDRLDSLGVLAANTVLVHGVAIEKRHDVLLTKRRPALVWCPASNQFLFGKTADIGRLGKFLKVALGTDSTLSGSPSLLDELRAARQTGRATPSELLEMVTTIPAEIFQLGDGRGRLTVGGSGDVLLIPASALTAAESLVKTHAGEIGLVLIDGQPRFATQDFLEPLGLPDANIRIAGQAGWLYGNPGAVNAEINRHVDESLLNRNPLYHRWEIVPTHLIREKIVT